MCANNVVFSVFREVFRVVVGVTIVFDSLGTVGSMLTEVCSMNYASYPDVHILSILVHRLDGVVVVNVRRML